MELVDWALCACREWVFLALLKQVEGLWQGKYIKVKKKTKQKREAEEQVMGLLIRITAEGSLLIRITAEKPTQIRALGSGLTPHAQYLFC